MFKKSLDRINEIFENSKKNIELDREKYIKIYEHVIEYVKKYKLYISNYEKLYSVILKQFGMEGEEIMIYCDNPLLHGNNITNIIHEKGGKWVKLNTVIYKTHLNINYDGRNIASIKKLIHHPKLNISDVINPVEIDNILYLPPEIELINKYHKLYLYEYCDEWEELMEIEEKLFPLIIERIKNKKILGGNKIDIKKIDIKKIFKEEYFENKNSILIGYWVFSESTEKIQIISEDINKEILNIKTFLSNYTTMEIISKEQNLHLPKDLRIKKYTIYINKTPIIDIYNSGEFETIPYVIKNNIKIGTKYVLLRFLLIDLWIIRVIKYLNLINNDILQQKIQNIQQLMIDLRKEKNNISINCIGKIINEKISLKSNNIMYYPYYPEKSLIEYNKYRLI